MKQVKIRLSPKLDTSEKRWQISFNIFVFQGVIIPYSSDIVKRLENPLSNLKPYIFAPSKSPVNSHLNSHIDLSCKSVERDFTVTEES